MKLDRLQIFGIPKKFDLWALLDLLEIGKEDRKPEDIKYDLYPSDCDEERGEDSNVYFKYNESATGVYVVHNSILQVLSFELPKWASEADVHIYVSLINGVLKKHPRAKLCDRGERLASLTSADEELMVKERKKFLLKKLAAEGFTMEGLNADYTLQVSHLKPEETIEKQAEELMKTFISMQWTFGGEK